MSAGQSVSFLSAGTLWLGDASAFKGSIQDFGTGDEIALAGFDELHAASAGLPPERRRNGRHPHRQRWHECRSHQNSVGDL